MDTGKYELLLDVVKNGLKTADHLLAKAEEYVKMQSIPEENLLSARLAPDMFPFSRQIQIVSDNARQYTRFLAGKEHIPMEDTETTIAALRERIKKSADIVGELTLADFEGADERHISLKWMGENYVEGKDFLIDQAIPNFIFHVTTAYAILRNQGVSIGKTDFITTLHMKPKNS